MEDPRKLRELAGWYRDFAEWAGNPAIWHAREGRDDGRHRRELCTPEEDEQVSKAGQVRLRMIGNRSLLWLLRRSHTIHRGLVDAIPCGPPVPHCCWPVGCGLQLRARTSAAAQFPLYSCRRARGST
jgi:hypothetical protein